ncbi:hypothetical protein [Salibacterium lacus]|uniref:MFS transporter n=1 Tax=Salibacterium lacus TaxID=1898109 RepID=A0ABW5T072_9BACI
MVFAAMAAAALVCFFVLGKLPASWNRGVQAQLVLSALLTAALIYLLHQLYSFPAAAVVFLVFMLFFSFLIGKQIQYTEEAAVEGEQLPLMREEEPVEERPEPALEESFNQALPAEDSTEPREEQKAGGSITQFRETENSVSMKENDLMEEENFFQRRAFMIEEEPQEETEEDTTDRILTTQKEETRTTEETEESHWSDKRAKLLNELDEKPSEDPEDGWRNGHETK